MNDGVLINGLWVGLPDRLDKLDIKLSSRSSTQHYLSLGHCLHPWCAEAVRDHWKRRVANDSKLLREAAEARKRLDLPSYIDGLELCSVCSVWRSFADRDTLTRM